MTTLLSYETQGMVMQHSFEPYQDHIYTSFSFHLQFILFEMGYQHDYTKTVGSAKRAPQFRAA